MWNFIKLLGLTSCTISSFEETDTMFRIHLVIRRKTAHCPLCRKQTKIVRSISRERKVKHGVIRRKECVLMVRQRRFTCQVCSKTFSEELPFVNKRQMATIQHKKEVVFNLSDRSFSSGTKQFHISYPTQRKWLKELIAHEVLNFTKEEQENSPFTLGIDEVSFAGRDMVTTIGNITKRRLKGVLHSRLKDELKHVLRSLPKKVKPLIHEVVIDMCGLYLKAVQETLPSASVVVDHFHIIHDANKRIDEQRLLLQDIFKKR